MPITLTTKEIDDLISNVDTNSKNQIRNIAIIEMLYSCGLRVTELITLKISDLYFDESIIKVTGKGNKERFVPISKEAINYVNKYLDEERNLRKIKKEM